MTIKKAISLRILQLCKENNITINKLANLAGIPQSTLNDIVHGKSKNPTVKTIYYICFGLGIRMKDFFDSDLFSDLTDDDD
ncbi:helix-turn-helix domain-containing protein [Caldicoprobacter algeriensis]|uniref:helix-turn-helix domain-containing protein n=1 Tax=Caldicoprobacter algeriensis TaxID=699281 RepID=UPI00207A3A0A|nr:helix-turn-helix transcriptional regulator [Caldicoprobacter algeriensis]MCM8901589.1 helix-turn-helix domain-containing protein [Caldicoprobacter algeriensis]